MIAVTLHFWDVSDSGEGRSADDFYMKQIEEELHAARGAGYNHAGVFSHLFSRRVRCRYDESANTVGLVGLERKGPADSCSEARRFWTCV